MVEHLARDSTGRNAHRRFARRLPPASTVIAQTVFRQIGVIRMAGAKLVADIGVVLRPRVDIIDQERNGRSCRELSGHAFVLEHAGNNPHAIRLPPLSREFRLAGPTLVQIGLNLFFGECDPRRAAVDHAADRRPMAFAKGGHAKKMAKGVKRHVQVLGERGGGVKQTPKCSSSIPDGDQCGRHFHSQGEKRSHAAPPMRIFRPGAGPYKAHARLCRTRHGKWQRSRDRYS